MGKCWLLCVWSCVCVLGGADKGGVVVAGLVDVRCHGRWHVLAALYLQQCLACLWQ
jgi:hypothetical protein